MLALNRKGAGSVEDSVGIAHIINRERSAGSKSIVLNSV
jgi:hypothetical protein